MAGVRRVTAVMICAVPLLAACSPEDPDDSPTISSPGPSSSTAGPSVQPPSSAPVPGGTFETPSRASTGVEQGELQVDAAKNEKGQYRLKPGQTITLTMDFRNYGEASVDTTIIIEALCDRASYKDTEEFRVPGSTHSPPESEVVTTWRGNATIPSDCKPLGISGVADGSLNAEVRPASQDPGYGSSSTVTFTISE